nr:immunoglobulin heavy chain junction region [Macaca mulatta]
CARYLGGSWYVDYW